LLREIFSAADGLMPLNYVVRSQVIVPPILPQWMAAFSSK
jgi:hypothetical protein